MRTIETKVYSFNELSEEAKENTIQRKRTTIHRKKHVTGQFFVET
jgi:hypothetical protein